MLKRYIGPFKRVHVPALGPELSSIELGESVYVPDELAESLGWPEDSWEDVKSTVKENKENA